jgi:hypothetical protein
VGFSEYGVVYLLAESVEHGNVVIGVFGEPVALNCGKSVLAGFVEPDKEIAVHHVVGVEHDDEVVSAVTVCHGILKGLGLRTVLENRFVECYRHQA